MTHAIQDLVFLSKRASLRRQRLGILARELSAQLGISYSTVKNWEVSLPHKSVEDVERRWEEALRVPPGWLRDPSIEDDAPIALAMDNTVDLCELGLTSVAQEINAVGTWLSRRLENARTFDASLLSELEARRAGMFATRYGVWGTERTTLHVIADEHKLTRERIRKIIEPMIQRAVGVTFVLPTLEKVRQLAHSTGPISVREFNERHRSLLGECLSFDDAERFAREIAGYSLANQWEKSLCRSTNSVLPMLGDDNTGQLAQAVRDASKQMARSCGAAHIKFVTGMVSQKIPQPISMEAVKNCLQAIDGLQWLTESQWFWFGPETKNFAVDSVKKMLLASAGPLDIEILHEGLCRSRRQSHDLKPEFIADIELPRFVLDQMLTHTPWLKKHHHNQFSLTVDLAIRDVLTDSEIKVIEAMRGLGGEATRNILMEKLVAKNKLTPSALQAILGSSPFIRNYEAGKYELRGHTRQS